MSYVQASLAPGEAVRWTGRLHWILWVRAWASLLLLGVILVGVVLFVRDLITLTTTEVAITNRRLIKKTGLFERHTSELELTSVEAVNVSQGVWGRLLGFGRVEVHGTGDDTWLSPLIAAPVEFRRALVAARNGSNYETAAAWPTDPKLHAAR